MNQELKNALKLITEKCNEPDWHLMMQNKSLSGRIQGIQTMLLQYVDSETINYRKTQIAKEKERILDDFRKVELSSREKEASIANLEWLLSDIRACISHLKD